MPTPSPLKRTTLAGPPPHTHTHTPPWVRKLSPRAHQPESAHLATTAPTTEMRHGTRPAYGARRAARGNAGAGGLAARRGVVVPEEVACAASPRALKRLHAVVELLLLDPKRLLRAAWAMGAGWRRKVKNTLPLLGPCTYLLLCLLFRCFGPAAP